MFSRISLPYSSTTTMCPFNIKTPNVFKMQNTALNLFYNTSIRSAVRLSLFVYLIFSLHKWKMYTCFSLMDIICHIQKLLDLGHHLTCGPQPITGLWPNCYWAMWVAGRCAWFCTHVHGPTLTQSPAQFKNPHIVKFSILSRSYRILFWFIIFNIFDYIY